MLDEKTKNRGNAVIEFAYSGCRWRLVPREFVLTTEDGGAYALARIEGGALQVSGLPPDGLAEAAAQAAAPLVGEVSAARSRVHTRGEALEALEGLIRQGCRLAREPELGIVLRTADGAEVYRGPTLGEIVLAAGASIDSMPRAPWIKRLKMPRDVLRDWDRVRRVGESLSSFFKTAMRAEVARRLADLAEAERAEDSDTTSSAEAPAPSPEPESALL